MARRSVSRAPAQDDLFAPKAPTQTRVCVSPDHYAGPVSQVTGGPLNGNEAIRVANRQSIAHAGGLYEDGTAVCKAHQDPWLPGHGFLKVVYRGTERDQELGRCTVCQAPLVGDPP